MAGSALLSPLPASQLLIFLLALAAAATECPLFHWTNPHYFSNCVVCCKDGAMQLLYERGMAILNATRPLLRQGHAISDMQIYHREDDITSLRSDCVSVREAGLGACGQLEP